MRAALKSQNGDDVMSSSPEEPAHRGSYMGVSSSPDGPTENARQRNTRKIWQHLEHFRTIAPTGRYEEETPHKARAGKKTSECAALNWPEEHHHRCCQLQFDGSEPHCQI
jgi:hypothetical protein